MSVKITDLVDQNEIDKITNLGNAFKDTKDAYIALAEKIVNGLNFKINGIEDLQKYSEMLNKHTKEEGEIREKLNTIIKKRDEIIANTTNTISRELAEQEKINKAHREAFEYEDRYKKLMEGMNGTYENRVRRLIQVESAIKSNKAAQKELSEDLKKGSISSKDYETQLVQLVAKQRELAQEKANLNTHLKNEEREMQTVSGSYNQMSQRLELLKKAYKSLNEEERNTGMGKELESAIQDLDAHLKDMAADMGEFQRNVGNYAIANGQLITINNELISVLESEATSVAEAEEQNKKLAKAISEVDLTSSSAQQEINAYNSKIEKNKKFIEDNTDSLEEANKVLKVNARTIEEAENQNAILQKAIKKVDLTVDGASEQIEEYSKKIEENTRFINQNSGASEGLVDSLGDLLGVNTQFGSSLQALSQNSAGSVFEGIGVKAKALGKTLMGLLANPYVLALLGIAGTVAAFKWWYDYNKGLVEATKLTKDFTGLTGDELKAARNEVQALADMYDKDFKEVLQSTNAISKQFGLSFQESLALVKDGFVAGADVNEEFLENIKEYPAYFREAGISASEFIAITTQANQAGIYSDKGIDVIKEGNLRIREMTTATADALEGIGISSKKVQEELANGSKTTFDIMQEVSAKLAEFPESSSAVGTALADIFGGPGEDAGLQYILTLKDIDTNLDNVKERAGELGKLQEEQLQSQIELENTIAAVFDATGGNFETMTTKAKTFVNNGIIAIIKGAVGIINYFRKLYNDSLAFRWVVESVTLNFKNMWNVVKLLFGYMIDQLKVIGSALHGAFTLNWDEVSAAWQKGIENQKKFVKDWIAGTKKNIEEGIQNIKDGQLDMIEINLDVTPTSTTTTNGNNGTGDGKSKAQKDAEAKEREKALKEQQKKAQEQLKILEALQQSEIDLMEEGYEKEVAKIKIGYAKRINAIKGNSEEELQTKANLLQEMNDKLAQYELAYNQQREKINLENKLATVKKGSKEELDLKLSQLDKQKEAELKLANRTGADITLIEAKYQAKRQELQENYASERIKVLQTEHSTEQVLFDKQYADKMNELKLKYARELEMAKGNAEKIAEIEAKYEKDSYIVTQAYAEQTVQNQIDLLKKQLQESNLSAEERKRLEEELTKAEINLSNMKSDAVIENVKREGKADDDLRKKRMDNVQKWLDIAKEAISAISDLASAIYDAQIEKIEEQQEANEEESEKEMERIDTLVEHKVITQEEGEARKRAAEEKTAKKNEELEKKKAQIQYKQALWEKATNLAQAGIATALAIAQALPNIALAAIAGAMGAIQVATILATPIPKYAKGTGDGGHSGGLAIVGDGGKREAVIVDNTLWITPDIPTLVDMPKGSVVFPDANKLIEKTAINSINSINPTYSENKPKVVVNNDYRNLERGIRELSELIKKQTKQQHKDACNAQYEAYKQRMM